MGYNMYGGYGGGMGGGSSSMMMSSAMGASLCLSVLAGGAYYMMNKGSVETDAPIYDDSETGTETAVPPASTPTSPTSAVSPSNLDGVRLITVGDLSMRVEGNCGNGVVTFRRSKDGRWEWNVKKAGTTSDGLNYYTLESFGKLFGNACNKRFLTAPYGCSGPPYLAGAQFGSQQYWVITGSDSSGYQIESLSCRQARKKSYLLQAGQKKKTPSFSARSGTTFRIESPPTA